MAMQGLQSELFWRGRKVLLTGHTGFKGAWLAMCLERLGAVVTGVALPPSSSPNLFTAAGVERRLTSHMVDVRDADGIAAIVRETRPEIVLHLAAQAVVRAGYAAPLETFSTNVQGTANVLDAVRNVDSVRVVVAVTTDKVYRNFEHEYPYRETDVLGGYDPYSASKAAAELVVDSYRDAYLQSSGVAVAAARAGNVIGGGDWTADRLIPDLVRAWSAGRSVEIRRPEAVRPWQHVLEPLHGYLVLAERLWSSPELAGAYNFGPNPGEAAPVKQVIELARHTFGKGEVVFGDAAAGPHEAGLLALDTSKARVRLGVQARWSLEEAVRRTLDWYRNWYTGADAYELCTFDITEFTTQARSGGAYGAL